MSNPPMRTPAVAGRFYPAAPASLEQMVDQLLGRVDKPVSRPTTKPVANRSATVQGTNVRVKSTAGTDSHVRVGEGRCSEAAETLSGRTPSPAVMAMVPHAGYIYSGAIAGSTFASVEIPETVMVLCPNHTGRGSPRALWNRGSWSCPLGPVRVAADLCRCLEEHADLEEDEVAHLSEHAIEVELPFLVRLRPDVSIAPLCLARLSLADCIALGHGLAAGIVAFGERVLIVCSTDMSHYISADEAARLDGAAIERVLRLDPEGLYRTVTEQRISMCGFVPTTVGLAAARRLGARSARLVRYGNSGERSGDFARVVGYAGVVVE